MTARAAVLCAFVLPFAAAAAQPDSNAAPFGAPVDDQPIYVHAALNQLEGRFGADNAFRWSGEAWAGTDTDRLWLRSEGEVTARGLVRDGQQELFYDRPITPYFDLQAGVRSDIDSAAGRTWAAVGIEGLAPDFVDVAATAYASDTGHYAAKLEASTDWLLTQRLILQPQIEMNFYTKDDPARATGSGLSDLDTGLRLRYELSRKFAPYIAVTYEGKYGGTARFARAAADKTGDLRFTIGLRTWF